MAAAGFGGFVLLVVAGVSYAYATTQVPTDAAQAATQQQSTVYFSDGKTVAGTLGTTDRQLLTYNQISPYMRDAVVAAEDRSFYNEGGVSPRGIVRAAYEDVFNSGGSQGSLQGGSTITQEFVRNYYANIGTQQTATRKIKEIFVALKVAKEKSKAWILTNYLNTIYLGNGAYGVGAAAKTYFGVSASQLTVAQAAEIAAIIQSPSYYPTPAGQRGSGQPLALRAERHGRHGRHQRGPGGQPEVPQPRSSRRTRRPARVHVRPVRPGHREERTAGRLPPQLGPVGQRRPAHRHHAQQADDGPAVLTR